MEEQRAAQRSEDEREIIAAVLRGETERFAELVERYKRLAWKLAYSFVGNFEDARELSQNAFLKAYRHLGRFRGDSRFSTWLCRIVLNECADFVRKRKREPVSLPASISADEEPVILEPVDPRAGPRELAQQREFYMRISAALERLPLQQRSAFVLHHLHGLTLEETAKIMGCRVGTAKSHLFRAARQLRKELE